MAKKEKKKSTFFKDFKAFISKGNVLDLAVATIVGASFSTIVASFTNGIMMPLVSLLFQAENLDKLVIVLRPATETAEAITWQYGTLIQAILNFIIVAFFLFVLVRVISKARKAMDIDANMQAQIQEKLDKDEPLTKAEKDWMKLQEKLGNDEKIPKKKVPEPASPKAPTTEELLTQILEEMRKRES